MNIFKKLCNGIPWRVSEGPFRMTRCELTATGDGVVAKLAATYEMEIYPALRHAVASGPSLVVDIGAAEGFYVAAMARALPKAKVVAYEAKEEWHVRIHKMLELNAVAPQCEIRGFCNRDEFLRILLVEAKEEPTFVLMDIEGGEFDLLTADVLPRLAQTELLVELHEPQDRAAGDALVAMLGETHHVEVIWAKGNRTPQDVPSFWWRVAAWCLPPVRQRLDEGRVYQMRWMHAVPKCAAASAE
jgi:hypothetical protein